MVLRRLNANIRTEENRLVVMVFIFSKKNQQFLVITGFVFYKNGVSYPINTIFEFI
jgi:hypothetical protein